ncbi:MAG: STAS domain-containing protein [Burkholderiales bacterium]|nr:STAS domain-containing protein [Burkholderiales bacterium]MDE2276298.1 STAS domain-containing protein [Burkholderiales bacterium]
MARRTKAQAVPPPAASPAPLVLPAELTIYTVGELHPLWLAWLGQVGRGGSAERAEAVVDVQAAAVDQIDAAGVQLLLSLHHALAALGRGCRVRDASAVLSAGCAALGLSDWLARRSMDGAAA